MSNREFARKKISSINQTRVPNPLQPRRLKIPLQAQSNLQQQETISISAQLEMASRFGYNGLDVPVNAPGTLPTPSVQRKEDELGMVQRRIKPYDARQSSGNTHHLLVNRQSSETSALDLPSSSLFSTVQCKKENEKALSDIQGLAMFDLLPKLQKLPTEVRTDEEAGSFVGGPRLVTAMRAVKHKDQGKSSSEFVNAHHNELVALKYEDQIGDVMKFLGAKDTAIKAFMNDYVRSIALSWKGAKKGANTQEIKVGDKGQAVGEKDEGTRRLPIQIDSSKQAIVLIPGKLNPAQAIDVLLHLHGHNAGYAGDSINNVRDVQKDNIEQQLLASGRNQMIAILPQGSNKSVFKDLNTTTYVSLVFVVLNNLGVWGQGKDNKPIQVKTEGHKVILSAHSGGGAKLSSLLEKGGKPTNPGGLEGLFLFDSINALAIPKKNSDGSIVKDKEGKPISSGIPDVSGSTELKRIRAFVAYQLDLELKELERISKLPGGTPDSKQKEFLDKSGFRLRGNYTPGWYEKIYAPLVQDIDDWFKTKAKAKLPSLDQTIIEQWSKNYVIQSVNAVSKVGPVGKGHQGHDYIVGQGQPAGKDGKDYDPAKGGALQDALGSIQRQSINSFVQGQIQRQSAPAPAVLTDAQQWEQDWNNYASHQHYFAGSGRPTGTPRQRYDVLCPLYKAHGIPRPMVYIDTSITTARFYNFSTPAHTNLAAALVVAENTLKGKGYTTAPVKSLWALNPRTTSAGGWSNHADGKAVDIDPNDNPHLTDKEDRKIMSLVSGIDLEKGGQGYDVLKGASDKFKTDYNPTGLQQRLTNLKADEQTKETERNTVKSELDTLKGQLNTLKSERDGLNKQLKAVPQGKKATADDLAKATALKASIQQKEADLKQVQMEIKQKEGDLKKKEADLKAATKDRELIEKELANYQATEKAISDLENAVKSLPSEIKFLEDQIAQSKQDEQDAKTAKNSSGVQAQQKLRAKLQQSLSQKKAALKKQQKQLDTKKKVRDADPLRKYGTSGFLNLSKDVVEAMTGAGLKWGGDWAGAKDFMHFEL
ncbi:MAG TPA: hypothetical protein DDZ80_03345 [Cyanobacteria bacterium UBA8803]|nr:hypothetical protein [Cyanobacteria bacterium UBA9273]HBL57608.1 hypothetical protein [Cyanobacteria bacterium UBA8803]